MLGMGGAGMCSEYPRWTSLTYYNLGVRGDTSADIAQRWREECLQRLSRGVGRVVFSFGVNDTNLEDGQRRVSLEATEGYARQILTQARESYPVLFIGLPPVADHEHNRRIAVVSGMLNRVAKELEIPYLPVFDLLLRSSVWMEEVGANDGFHPGAAGYTELARLIGSWSDWWF